MVKAELITKVSEAAGVSKKDTENVLKALTDVMVSALVAKDEVTINGLGLFKTTHRLERKGKNPATKEAIIIPAKTVVVFKPTKQLKEAVK